MCLNASIRCILHQGAHGGGVSGPRPGQIPHPHPNTRTKAITCEREGLPLIVARGLRSYRHMDSQGQTHDTGGRRERESATHTHNVHTPSYPRLRRDGLPAADPPIAWIVLSCVGQTSRRVHDRWPRDGAYGAVPEQLLLNRWESLTGGVTGK